MILQTFFYDFPAGCWAGPDERRLLQHLMENYQKFERPVENESQSVRLQFGLTLQQIMDLVEFKSWNEKLHLFQDEKNQILTTNVWLNLVISCKEL